MKPLAPGYDCGDEAARLLPWFVNGTLGADDARRVRAHLEGCANCRTDAARLETMGALLRAPSSVQYAPQAGLRKLNARVDHEEARAAAAPAAIAATAPAANVATPAGAPRRAWPALRSPVRWLALAVAVQAAAIAAIVGAGVLTPAPADAPAAFRTLTAPPGADGPRLRVVFTPAMTLAELQDLLRANRLVVVAGPSEAGIFTLALHLPAPGGQAQAAVVERLRADGRVRFAEPVGDGAGKR